MHFPIHFTWRAHEYPITLNAIAIDCIAPLLNLQDLSKPLYIRYGPGAAGRSHACASLLTLSIVQCNVHLHS